MNNEILNENKNVICQFENVLIIFGNDKCDNFFNGLLCLCFIPNPTPDTPCPTNKFNNIDVLLPRNDFLKYIFGIEINNENFCDNINGYYNYQLLYPMSARTPFRIRGSTLEPTIVFNGNIWY